MLIKHYIMTVLSTSIQYIWFCWPLKTPINLIFYWSCVLFKDTFILIIWRICTDILLIIGISMYSIKTMFGSSLPPVFCKRAHILFTLFVFACVEWCPTDIVLCFGFVVIRLVWHVLPVSLDWPFFYCPFGIL